jgi:hypothetical protein
MQLTLLQCAGFHIMLSCSLLFGGGTPACNVSYGYFALFVDFGTQEGGTVSQISLALLSAAERDLGLFGRRFGPC